jgi:hypothetical protein
MADSDRGLVQTTMSKQLPADRDALAEIVRRIVQVAAPERIVLFGSAARGVTFPPIHDLAGLLTILGQAGEPIPRPLRRRLASPALRSPPGTLASPSRSQTRSINGPWR